MNESVSIIDSVELIPLEMTEINPFLTKVRIKVFHLGENRNHSFIDKDTAISMAKTLRGNPIVARYRPEDGDFTDHGQEIVINDKGVTTQFLTRPYGFVDLNAQVWFEDYDDTDEKGQIIKHTYLVTEGMIWSKYYEELQNTILDGGRPQSMELDEDTLSGYWTKKGNSNYEIFIINDAIITKLCALGEETEPCFLGASITPLFSEYKDENFVKELLDFKQKFKDALNLEGGNKMDNVEQTVVEEVKSAAEFTKVAEVTPEVTEPTTDPAPETFAKEKEDEKKEEGQKEEEKPSSDESGEKKESSDEKKEDEKDEKKEDKKYELLETQYSQLQADYEALKKECEEVKQFNTQLAQFKLEVENKEKDALIAKFTMLSEEDKAEVIANKEKYSLADIESKLSILYCRQSLAQAAVEEVKEDKENNVTTFNLTEVDEPDWIKAVKSHREQD